MSSNSVSYGKIIALAWPASVAASITPLLGVIDVWALGQSSNPLGIAAVGLAATIFSLIYWTFGFIRMSVAGLAAQASGAGDFGEARLALLRALIIASAVGLVLVGLQVPIGRIVFAFLGIGSEASIDTFAAARDYFYIRIWGAPFALATYACLGWLTARGRTDFLMLTGLAMTAINVVLDIWFVLYFDFGAAGIALGTLIAEIAGFAISAWFVAIILRRDGLLDMSFSRADILAREMLVRTLSINRDIFIRTLLLAFSFTWFVQRGSAYGDVTLGANQILLQLFLFSGLALDGTAIAAETLVGRIIGDRAGKAARERYDTIVRRSFILASAGAGFFMLVYFFLGDSIIALLTTDELIYRDTIKYLPWVIISPLMVMVCFQLDGIFIGATRSREMRDSMIISVLIFLPLSLWLGGRFGNHGLWLAFSIYFLIRAVTLWRYMPRIRQQFIT